MQNFSISKIKSTRSIFQFRSGIFECSLDIASIYNYGTAVSSNTGCDRRNKWRYFADPSVTSRARVWQSFSFYQQVKSSFTVKNRWRSCIIMPLINTACDRKFMLYKCLDFLIYFIISLYVWYYYDCYQCISSFALQCCTYIQWLLLRRYVLFLI